MDELLDVGNQAALVATAIEGDQMLVSTVDDRNGERLWWLTEVEPGVFERRESDEPQKS